MSSRTSQPTGEGAALGQEGGHVANKTRIGEFLGAAPDDLRGMIGGIDFVDLNTGDAEYWDVGIDKVLRGAARNNKKLENALQVLKRARSQV